MFLLICKGRALTFLMRGFGLSKKLSMKVGFDFFNKGLKSPDLIFGIKENICFFLNNVSGYQIW